MNADLIEIFSSIQGEGKCVGVRQVFVRFAGCNLRCAYCDTNFNRPECCHVETHAGSMTFDDIKNPVDVDDVAAIIDRLSRDVTTHSISLTGGEPLIHWDFVNVLVSKLNVAPIDRPKIFLETNGTLSDELERVIDMIDIISMDIKLPSIVGRDLFDVHRRFINTARQNRSIDLYVKIVVSDETTADEFRSAIETIAAESRDIMLIIQPVTPIGSIKRASPEKILSCQAVASKLLSDVRVIPQTHKIIALP